MSVDGVYLLTPAFELLCFRGYKLWYLKKISIVSLFEGFSVIYLPGCFLTSVLEVTGENNFKKGTTVEQFAELIKS